MKNKIKVLFLSLLIALFAFEAAPAHFFYPSAAEAKIKRKKKRRIIRRKRYRVPRGSLKIAINGKIAQSYHLEEVVDSEDAENLIKELKSLGVEEASFDFTKNTVQVKFKTRELSAIAIISKLRELGYTVKQID